MIAIKKIFLEKKENEFQITLGKDIESFETLTEIRKKLGDLNQYSFYITISEGEKTLLEQRGSKLALLTTKGVSDTFEMMTKGMTQPFFRRRDVFEIETRMGADGKVSMPLMEESILDHLPRISQYEVLAVSILHGGKSPEQEKILFEMLKDRLPEMDVVLSHRVLPSGSFYRRTKDTVITAYIEKNVREELSLYRSFFQENHYKGPLYFMDSEGDVHTEREISRLPILTLKREEKTETHY